MEKRKKRFLCAALGALALFAVWTVLVRLVDVKPIGLGRGDPSGRDVGLFQIAQLLQLTHLVSDGSGRNRLFKTVGQGLGAHGFGGTDVALDDRLEDPSFAFGQFHAVTSSF